MITVYQVASSKNSRFCGQLEQLRSIENIMSAATVLHYVSNENKIFTIMLKKTKKLELISNDLLQDNIYSIIFVEINKFKYLEILLGGNNGLSREWKEKKEKNEKILFYSSP